MSSKLLAKLLAATPTYIKEFNGLYSDLIVRVHEILTERGISQNELAKRMDKRPSEISKWLNGGHNLTLMSIAKLQAELGEPLLYVPQKRSATSCMDEVPVKFTVFKNLPREIEREEEEFVTVTNIETERVLPHAS